MSDAVRRRSRREMEFTSPKDILRESQGKWPGHNLCEEEDYVNCTFGSKGECTNPRHSRSFTKE